MTDTDDGEVDEATTVGQSANKRFDDAIHSRGLPIDFVTLTWECVLVRERN